MVFHSFPPHLQWWRIQYLLPILFYEQLQILEMSSSKSYFDMYSNIQEMKYFWDKIYNINAK